MWISKKKWKDLEQRIANLEKEIQNWQNFDPVASKKFISDYLRRFQSKATRDSAPKPS